MAATGWLIRRQLRRRWVALISLALITALGASGALVAGGAADRTARAYGDYLDRAEVSEVVINPSLFTTDIDRVIRGLPGVRSVTSDAIFLARIDEGAPVMMGGGHVPADLAVRGSTDGRYVTADRPALAEGRMPTGADEVLANVELAEAEGLEVGDVVPLAFKSARDALAGPTEDLPTVGVEQVTVVGIATFVGEVLPDALYPGAGMMVLSPALTARYDCLPDPRLIDTGAEAVEAQLIPPGCATAYRYYSLEVDGGGRQVAAALDAYLRESAELNAALPPTLTETGAGYYLIASTTADERERVERSTQPTVTALAVLAVVAGVVTVVVLALAGTRELRRGEDDQRQWWRLGLPTRARTAVLVVPLLVAFAVGLVVALAVAWWLSPVGPVGSVRSVEPSPARALSDWVATGALALAVIGTVGAVALSFQSARAAGRARGRVRDRAPTSRLAARTPWPDIDEGVRAAYGGNRGAGLVVANCGLAVGAFLAAAVFAASLSAIFSTPAAYGWPWDAAVMGGYGYGGVDREAADDALDGRGDVESRTWLGLTNDVSVDGEPVLAVVALDQRSGVDFTVVEGRLPQDGDEVALGSRTAAGRGVGVGDTVALDGDGIEPRRVTVTGLAVLPPIGYVQADRTSPGTGLVVAADAFAPDIADDLFTFVGVDLVPGADRDAVVEDVERSLTATNGSQPFGYREAVRPPEIVNVQSMRAVPLLVGGLLTGAAVVGLGVAVVLSVRARRRELAILRALGFTGRQVRNSVRAQAVATMAAALVVGVPLGIAVGRVAWRAFASRLGVVTDPSTPGLWIAATVAGALVLAVAASAMPGRVAARIRPATVLRTE
jgi:uncharacterized membrane protein